MGDLRQGPRTGVTFGVILIFLMLIGFCVTAAEMVGGILKTESTDLQQSSINLMVFIGLIGFWCGSASSKSDSILNRVLNALLAGLVVGVISGLLAFGAGTMDAADIKIRTTLNALSPATIQLYNFGRSPLASLGLYVLILVISAMLGSLVAFGSSRIKWRQLFRRAYDGVREPLNQMPILNRIVSGKIGPALLAALLGAALLVVPLLLGQYWNYNLGTVGIYVLMGLGLNIVVGQAGLLDLGYVAFFAVGAYTVGLLTTGLASLSGILLGIPVLRMRGDYLAIVTLGFGEIIRILAKSDALSGFTGGPQGVRDIAGPSLFGQSFTSERDFMYLIMIGIAIVIFVTIRLKDSRIGRAWVAIREDETVAQAMGISTFRYKLMAFAIGAAFAGIGGVLFAARNQYTGPEDHTLFVSINVLCLIIVGGMGSIPGALLGAFALKGLPEILRQLENYRILAFGGLLVVMMILMPEGLWPEKRRKLEMHQEEDFKPPEDTPSLDTEGITQ
jgi:branched-chain amino acid transport system permease protein